MASLQTNLDARKNPLELVSQLRGMSVAFPVVPATFTTWENEQRAWKEDAVLFDQTHHMNELYIEGPDALKLLSYVGVNSFEGFVPGKAKQLVACNPDGYLIGDGILFYLHDGRILLAGMGFVNNWVEFHAQRGGYDVTFTRSDATRIHTDGGPIDRPFWRYQLQGPKAWQLIEKLNGGPLPPVKFFNMAEFSINGVKVGALRHGMAGAAGLEFWGPYEGQQEVLATILEAGKEFGLERVGHRAYLTSAIESGWLAMVMPAIYTGEGMMREYREWLPPFARENFLSIGGSFEPKSIEDYYLTPFDLSYDVFMKFNHDFIGREALEVLAARRGELRHKVTLEWNAEDVSDIYASMFNKDGPNYKIPDLPFAPYAFSGLEQVLLNGKQVGVALNHAYSAPEKAMLSIATVDKAVPIGTEVTMVWGERTGAFDHKVIPHAQKKVRAIVSTSPYTAAAKTLRS